MLLDDDLRRIYTFVDKQEQWMTLDEDDDHDSAVRRRVVNPEACYAAFNKVITELQELRDAVRRHKTIDDNKLYELLPESLKTEVNLKPVTTSA